MGKYKNWHETLLTESVSTDETRYHLNGVAFDAEGKHWFSTDGHRLAVVESGGIGGFLGTKEVNRIYEINAFKAQGLVPIEGEPINWKQFVPDTTTDSSSWTALTLTVPMWFKLLKGNKPAIMGITSSGHFTTDTKSALVALNCCYLRVFADMEVSVSIKDHLSPIVVRPTKGTDWTYVVMPVRK